MTPDTEVPAKLPLSVNDRPARHYKRVVDEHAVIKRPERHGGYWMATRREPKATKPHPSTSPTGLVQSMSKQVISRAAPCILCSIHECIISVMNLILQIREAFLSGCHGLFLWPIITYRSKISTSIKSEWVTQQGGCTAQLPLPLISFPHLSFQSIYFKI